MSRSWSRPARTGDRSARGGRRRRSITTPGQSVIFVELEPTMPVDQIQETWEKVRAKIEVVRPSLPDGVRAPVVDDDFGDTSVMLLALYEKRVLDGGGGAVLTAGGSRSSPIASANRSRCSTGSPGPRTAAFGRSASSSRRRAPTGPTRRCGSTTSRPICASGTSRRRAAASTRSCHGSG